MLVLRCIYFIDIANCCCCLVFPAPCPHHPNSRSGHCDEAREHFGVRQTRDSFGAGRRDVRVIRQGWHVDSWSTQPTDRTVGFYLLLFWCWIMSSMINRYIWKVVLESAVLEMTSRNNLMIKQLPSPSISLCNLRETHLCMDSFILQLFIE